jgi:UDP-N-acetylmuramoylalanine--D-glutamate ligase
MRYIAILSGIPKNEDLTPLIEELKTYAKAVLVFGEMEKEVKKYNLNHKFIFKNNLEEVFLYLSEICEVGDNVVFSPGGASFDKYKNYEERGEHFNSLVEKS